MARQHRWWRWMVGMGLGGAVLAGCAPAARFKAWKSESDLSYYQTRATSLEYPDVATHVQGEIQQAARPWSVENPAELPTWDLTLAEATQMALQSSEVLRSLGGAVVQAPQGTATVLDPALADSNPFTGVEGALAAFDTQLGTRLFWAKNNRPNNNSFLLLFPTTVEQTTSNYESSVSKTTAFGTQFALRHNVAYDNNNSPFRLFRTDFVGFMEAEMRQPLLQGAGTTYNRIAGPGRQPGNYNGVLIARINNDVSLADFENGVINLLDDVEDAYWELYFAYRTLEAQVSGRDNALRTWQLVNAKFELGARGGRADQEAQVRSQYFLFEAQVNDALAATQGLYAAEQRLRYMLGLPPNDGRLIRPVEHPTQAEVMLDWEQAVGDALTQRVEVRRQKWQIKRRELELIAARLNRRPRLDAVTTYRWRGLGDHLIGGRDPDNSFESLYQSIFEGDFQEWAAGMELNLPVGLRQASAAARFAQLNLAREVALLNEQELRISHDLSNASRQIDRSYQQVQNNFNRVEADKRQVEALRARFESQLDDINFLLQAQQQLAQSQSSYYRALVDYQIALKDFHRQKGSLLGYHQVQLSEAGWPSDAYGDAYQRGRFFRPADVPAEVPAPISRGSFDPSLVGGEGVATELSSQSPVSGEVVEELVEPQPQIVPLGDFGGSGPPLESSIGN